ncbi:hypothetical protein CVR96_26565, partial [Salmonella enterica subsp. enterica serovar Typhimurium]|uniref:hypothetical protein n=1 Tax=Salmonella enterica TaxID=28901 RepID=UPI000CB9DC80
AKDLVSSIVGETTNATVEKDSQPVEQRTAPKPTNKTITELAQEVIQGNFGSVQDRKNALGSKYDEVQAKVNEILTGSSSTNSDPDRTITQVAQDVIDGKYGNGEARKRNVYTDVYNSLFYTSDAADDPRCVDLDGHSIIKKKN